MLAPMLLPSSISIPKPTTTNPSSLSSLTLTRTHFHTLLSFPPSRPHLSTPIRMGGGPRTYPGGVSKWQWKRMHAKKSKQLLQARLLRERQIYEMRKRAELKAAVAELEKPWQIIKRAPTLFSVSADEQVKALADRFQKPGGFDMWSERDGPQVFVKRDDGSVLPSHRFFPEGVVHSVRPYGVGGGDGEESEGVDDWNARDGGGVRRRRRRRRSKNAISDDEDGSLEGRIERTEGVRRNPYEGRDGRVASYGSPRDRGLNSEGHVSENGRLGMEDLKISRKERNGMKAGLNLRRGARWNSRERSDGKVSSFIDGNEGFSTNGHLDLENLKVSSKHRNGMKDEGVRWNSYVGREDRNSLYGNSRDGGSSSERHGKAAGRRYGSVSSSSSRGLKKEKVSLRPTTDLFTKEGTERTRDLKWSEGNNLRRNRGRSL